MPIADIAQARDLIYGVLLTALTNYNSSLPVIYADKTGTAPDTGAYVEASLVHNGGAQATLGGAGGRRWRSHARLIVDVFTDFGDGLAASDPIVKAVQNAFRGKITSPDAVEFQGVRVAEQPRDGSRSKTRVVVDCVYDELV